MLMLLSSSVILWFLPDGAGTYEKIVGLGLRDFVQSARLYCHHNLTDREMAIGTARDVVGWWFGPSRSIQPELQGPCGDPFCIKRQVCNNSLCTEFHYEEDDRMVRFRHPPTERDIKEWCGAAKDPVSFSSCAHNASLYYLLYYGFGDAWTVGAEASTATPGTTCISAAQCQLGAISVTMSKSAGCIVRVHEF